LRSSDPADQLGGAVVTTWKPLIVCPSADTARRLRSALRDAGLPDAAALETYPPPGAIASIAERAGSTLCLIDLSPNPEQALAAISEAASVLPVVALIPRNDADAILRALRRGAREFLAEPTAEQIQALLERLDRLDRAAAPPAPQRKGRLLCIVPGKPGCGASTLATHLAACAHSSGDAKTLLVDLDPLTASIGFLLKLKAEYHVGDVIRDWKRMDDDLWSRLVAPSSGVDVLLAPENPAAPCPVASEVATALAAFWRARYDTVVLDLPDARAASDSGFAALADDILLVSTNELAALHATRRAVLCFEQTVPGRSRLRLVLNRYTPAMGLRREDVRTALQIEPYAVLSNDYDTLQSAILEGRPAAPSSRFAAGVVSLSQRLHGHTTTEKKSGLLGFLARRR
jgi:pilus assembly protein CpaE